MVSQSPKINLTALIYCFLVGLVFSVVMLEPNAEERNQRVGSTYVRELCVKGVTYYDFYGYTGAVSVALDKDSKVISCGTEK